MGRYSGLVVLLWALLMGILFGSATTLAQDDSSTVITEAAVNALLEETKELLIGEQAALDDGGDSLLGDAMDEIQRELEGLQTLKHNLERQEQELDRLVALANAKQVEGLMARLNETLSKEMTLRNMIDRSAKTTVATDAAAATVEYVDRQKLQERLDPQKLMQLSEYEIARWVQGMVQDELDEYKDNIMSLTSASGASSTTTTGDCAPAMEVIQDIQVALTKFSHDVIGLIDHAQGAEIVHSMTSRTYVPPPEDRELLGNVWWRKFIPEDWELLLPEGWESWNVRIPSFIYHSLNAKGAGTSPPETILEKKILPGACWPMDGNSGEVTIRLPYTIKVESFSLDHVPWSIIPEDMFETAPKKVKVIAYPPCPEPDECGALGFDATDPMDVAHLEYDLEGPMVQTFNSIFVPAIAVDDDDDDDDDDDVETDTQSIRVTQLKRQQSKPLISKERLRLHRKTMSVEDRLAGLTFAMWNMEDESEGNVGQLPRPRSPDGSSGDQFGKDASMIAGHDIPMPLRNRLDTAGSKIGGLSAVAEDDEPNSNEYNQESNTSSDDDDESPSPDIESNGPSSKRKNRRGRRNGNPRRSSMITGAADKLKDDWDIWKTFFRPRREHMMAYIKRIVCWTILPLIGIAAILFYLTDNPPTGRSVDGEQGTDASASWWLLFVVRQIVTATMALGLQVFIIDFLCIGTKGMLRLLGPLLTLMLVQAKGWPFVVFCWSVLDFGMLYGENDFVEHWGYWQEWIGMFTSENPSGGVVGSDWNKRVLLIGVTVSIFVALKRFVVGLLLGRQTFHHYGEQLAKVMHRMVLIGEVGHLSKRIAKSHNSRKNGITDDFGSADLDRGIETIKGLTLSYDDDEDDNGSGSFSTMKTMGTDKLIDTAKRDPLTGSLLPAEKAKLMQLIDRWEEPDRQSAKLKYNISISSVLKFRNAITFIRNDYPFSYGFGLADSREACIDSAQDVYNRLLLSSIQDERMLQFETLALCALHENGTIDQAKAKDLIRVFRPDRNGCLSILDFVKSVDSVYKEFRLLQASIENSSQIDRAFENIVNVIFYTVVVTIVMSQLGFDPLALFLSLSSVILAFAFMIGSASSKYFEGLLFILVRRPYGIGDLIHCSSVESETNIDGSVGWLVQHVTLFETVVTWLPTQETASLSNGSLANSRVINWARSPNARFVIFFVCPIETKYETLELFKRAVEEYLKVRPREWLAFNAFRVIGVFADKGYMKVEVVVQHRDSWQNIGQILDSRGNLISFCHEVQKILGMEYRAPPLPIDLNGSNIDEEGRLAVETNPEKSPSSQVTENDTEAKTSLFRSAAQQRHNLKIG